MENAKNVAIIGLLLCIGSSLVFGYILGNMIHHFKCILIKRFKGIGQSRTRDYKFKKSRCPYILRYKTCIKF